MKKKYDVIIIGAGPAGLKCAEQLKNSDLSVLLIEKNKIIGPKICAGGLTGLVSASDIPKNKIKNFVKQTFLLGSNKYIINLVNPLKTVDRLDLGQHLLKKIENSTNITIQNETSAKSINRNSIKTDRGTFYFKYIVGADGSSSIVRKYLGLKSEISIGVYYNIQNITNDLIWHLNPKLLKSGYLWVFPHKNYTNIGIYYNPKYLNRKKAQGILKEYITNKGFIYSDNNFHGAPINHLFKGTVFDNFYLIGDAAGLASKLSGEGVSYALISGSEIGKKILNPDYEMVKLTKLLKIKQRQEKILKIFDQFAFSSIIQTLLSRTALNLLKMEWFQSHFEKRNLKIE